MADSSVATLGMKNTETTLNTTMAASQSPSHFFNHIRRLAYAHNLIGSGEAGSETSTFGLLNEYNQTHQNGKNDDENNQYCVHVYDFLFLLFIINFSKKRIWSAK